MAYSQIHLEAPVAVAGMKATPDQSIYTPVNYLVGDSAGIPVGQFVAASSTAGEATATITAAADVLGFVERVINYFNYDLTDDGTLTVKEGYPLTVALRGNYYVPAPASVSFGDPVYCGANGAIVASSAGTKYDTGWKYFTAGAKDDMVIITNWGAQTSVASAGTAAKAAALDPGAKINGVNFTGADDITITAADPE